MNFNSKELFANYSDLTIRKVALAMNLNYNMMLKASKKPVVNEVYDASAVNYDAIDAYVNTRVNEDVIAAIDFAELNTESAAAKVTLPKEFKVSDVIKLRDDVIYEIILMTATHIVLNPTTDSTQPRVLNNATFLHQSPKFVDETVKSADAE